MHYFLQPGKGLSLAETTSQITPAPSMTISELIIDFFPTNILKSMAEANMIQVTIFATIFGIAVSIINKEKGSSSFLTAVERV